MPKSFKTFLEESNKSVDHHFDYMPDHENTPSHDEIKKHIHKYGGKSLKIHSVEHDGPGGGASMVHVKGDVKHVMKLHNYHHDENYSEDHAGHKQMTKDYS